jgi:hypothetical protein
LTGETAQDPAQLAEHASPALGETRHRVLPGYEDEIREHLDPGRVDKTGAGRER